MKVRLEHLDLEDGGISAEGRDVLRAGSAGGIPVPRVLAEVPRPEERHDPGQRALLAEALFRGHSFHEPPGRVLTSIRTLEGGGGLCVITGQQPGLCASPLYSLYKGMQACRLATELSRQWGVPVVPVFWNHADDHDIAEVHHAYQLNRNLDLQKLGLAGLSSGRQPVSRIVLDDERHRLPATRAMLANMYEELPHAGEAIELFFPRHGETLARAFTRVMSTLLGPHGLLVVEPDWIRPSLSSALAEVISADPLPHLIEGSGASAAIEPSEAALVYHVDEGGRRPLRCAAEGFRYDGEQGSRTTTELAAEIVGDHERWSAGALLRPLVQDAVFPVCAYVGGWGELGYHAQLAPIRDAVGLPRTPFVPRVSVTLLGAEIGVALERTDTSLAQAMAAVGGLDPAGFAVDEHPTVLRLREQTEAVAQRLLGLRGELSELEPALALNLKRTVDQIAGLLGRLAEKAQRVHDNRSGKGRRQLRRLNNTLYPRGLPQERVLGPLQFYARYGPGWVEELYRELPACASAHLAAWLIEED